MRIPFLLLATAATAATGATPPAPLPAPTRAETPLAVADAPPARLPGFAAVLADRAMVGMPQGWTTLAAGAGWPALVRATAANRQEARWGYAASLIEADRMPEAFGVLQVMMQDDPDLALVPSFQLASGAAMVGMKRGKDALIALAAPGLATNAEACAWRMRAYVQAGLVDEALQQVNCAIPAINARGEARRAAFVLDAANAAIDKGQTAPALQWLGMMPDRDPRANLVRGRALMAEGKVQEGRLRLSRAQNSGDLAIAKEVQLIEIESAVAQNRMQPRDALKKLDAIRFGWRGGIVEKRALQLSYRLANDLHEIPAALRSGAGLLRYFELGKDAGPMLTQIQGMLATMLAADSKLPIATAAGLYWDYREFAPAGGEGDLLVLRLAGRLEDEGLPARAAELLEYQLKQRAQDVARGPLSVKVAMLHILSGHPDRAIEVLRTTENPSYTQQMLWDRKRVEAAALVHLGKTQAALAALDSVPDALAIRAEIAWKAKDWEALAGTEGGLPASRKLNEVGQAAVLRHAIALAMLGREDRLYELHQRYSAAFNGLPTAGAFNVLTGNPSSVDPTAVEKAMAAIPSASPAGGVADLLDAAPAKK